MAPRLQEKYRDEIVPKLMQTFNITNKYGCPRIEKVVINMGVGEALQDIKLLDKAMEELGLITGRKPLMRRAKTAISNFKTKKNNPIGCKVTLRKATMYEFIDRLINISLPRIRDFRGVSPHSFDDAGNFTLGITEQSIFLELDIDRLSRSQGMDITFVIKNAKTTEQARELLRLFGMPFKTAE